MRRARNYLRVRGEYSHSPRICKYCSELPPRARRIRKRFRLRQTQIGTTSACAENTKTRIVQLMRYRNYLRVRGEYVTHAPLTPTIKELPPRARRIRRTPPQARSLIGTTSACAENTCVFRTFAANFRNYLRVRGEYFSMSISAIFTGELPPRARRIPSSVPSVIPRPGTTSACAENTLFRSFLVFSQWNYLRVRGEYRIVTMGLMRCLELPPRARRIRGCDCRHQRSIGTTSACAENTFPCFIIILAFMELPPRARRIPTFYELGGGAPRTTSACAENTLAG